MSENIEYIKRLIKILKIGELQYSPRQLLGGLSHINYAISTSLGDYVIKLLNPTVMARPEAADNYRNSERLAQMMADEIFAVTALSFNDDVLVKFENRSCMVFPLVSGEILSLEQITVAHCEKIGKILGKIHARKIIIGESANTTCPIYSWEYPMLAPEVRTNLQIINGKAAEALLLLMPNQVMSHRDLDPKNVLWDNNSPRIIDWEAAGMIHPALELWECMMNWAISFEGNVSQEKVVAIFGTYSQNNNFEKMDWANIANAGYAGMLGWLNYNLQRASSLSLSDSERNLGKEQVETTLAQISKYEEQSRDLTRFL